MNSFRNFLEEIGLDYRESAIYTYLLKVTEAPASQIARALEINRTTVYSLINNLINRGLISQVWRSRIQFYAAVNPLTFLEKFRFEQKKLLGKVNNLSKEFDQDLLSGSFFYTKPKVNFLIGEEGIKDLLSDIISESKEAKALMSYQLYQFIDQNLPDYIEQRVQKGIQVEVIYTFGVEKFRHDLEPGKQLRIPKFRPDADSRGMNFFIYGHKTALIFLKEKFGLIVESFNMKESFEQYFAEIWNQ